jgi:hypothetical protein
MGTIRWSLWLIKQGMDGSPQSTTIHAHGEYINQSTKHGPKGGHFRVGEGCICHRKLDSWTSCPQH